MTEEVNESRTRVTRGYPSGQERSGVKFVAAPGTVNGYGGGGINGTAYRGENGYLFLDGNGSPWLTARGLSSYRDAALAASSIA